MKKTLLTTALFLSMAGTSVHAHHPAADIVDPEIYAMIDENVADTPHADLTFDDMGSSMESAADAMESRGDMGGAAQADAAMEADMEAGMGADVSAMMDARGDVDEAAAGEAAFDTFTLLEDIDRAVAE